MYWLPKMLKTPICARFVVASNYCSAKPVSEIFKMIFNAVESLHNKSPFIEVVRNSGLCNLRFQLTLSQIKLMSGKKLNLFKVFTLAPYK